MTVTPHVKITSSWRHEMPEFYDVIPRQHVPMAPLAARFPAAEPAVNFTAPVELGYTTTQAVAEATRCLMCNYNIWFDPFRCVLCGACADVCPVGVIHMVDVNQLKSQGQLPELEEGQFYYFQLIGLPVLVNGEPVGKVVDVDDAGAQDVLVVQVGTRRHLIPLQAPYVKPSATRIEVEPIPGLLDQ
ncbi:MAG: hypothetical protein C4299_04550 [Thermoleophilia bacterium]